MCGGCWKSTQSMGETEEAEKARKIASIIDDLKATEYIDFEPRHDRKVLLDGRFTAEELNAIAWYMKNKKPI